jgi:hypothetical protein
MNGGNSDEIYEAGLALIELGEDEVFDAAIVQRYGPEVARRIRAAVRDQEPYSMPPSDLLESVRSRRR